MSTETSWYQKVKNTINDNVELIVAGGAVVVATVAALRAYDSANQMAAATEQNELILKSIEEKIGIAIEAPTIVRVELGDGTEVYGYGNRVD